MLVIRMQRTGRTGHAQFRVVAQDSRTHPSSGRVVAYLGSYDPHTKAISIKNDEIKEYMTKGAQPSDRVIKLLKKEGVKLPKWVESPKAKKKDIKNPEKLRRNRPDEPKTAETVAEPKPDKVEENAPAKVQEVVKEAVEDAPVAEDQKSDSTPEPETPAEEAKKEESKSEAEQPVTEEKAEETDPNSTPVNNADESPKEPKSEK